MLPPDTPLQRPANEPHPHRQSGRPRSQVSQPVQRRSYATKAPSSSSDEPQPQLTHLDSTGAAHMVSISTKAHTRRRAIAIGQIHFSNAVPADLIARNAIKKGAVLGIARIAGITAAKKTPEMIPLCHPIPLSSISVDLDLRAPREASEFGHVDVMATVECTGATGVEMEALMAVWGACSTVYDMCKAVDKGMMVLGIKVVLKEGGRSGTLIDPDWADERAKSPQGLPTLLQDESSPPAPSTSSPSPSSSSSSTPQSPSPSNTPNPLSPHGTRIGPNTGFISTARPPPPGGPPGSPPAFTHTIIAPPDQQQPPESGLKLIAPAVGLMLLLFVAVEYRRSVGTGKNEPRTAPAVAPAVAPGHASGATSGNAPVPVSPADARQEREARRDQEARDVAMLLGQRRERRRPGSTTNAAENGKNGKNTPVHDMGVERALNGGQGRMSESERTGEERTVLDKTVTLGMLVVWPVLHVLWYLMN